MRDDEQNVELRSQIVTLFISVGSVDAKPDRDRNEKNFEFEKMMESILDIRCFVCYATECKANFPYRR